MRISRWLWAVLLLVAAAPRAKAQVSIFNGNPKNELYVDAFDQDLPADSTQTVNFAVLPTSTSAEGKLSTADVKFTADLSTSSFAFGYSDSTDSADYIQDDGDSRVFFTADPNTSFGLTGSFNANNDIAAFHVDLLDVTQSDASVYSFDNSAKTATLSGTGALTAGDEYELDGVLSLFNRRTDGSLTSSASLNVVFSPTITTSGAPLPSAGPATLLLAGLFGGARLLRVAQSRK